MLTKQFTLKKYERLKSRKSIQLLFAKGKHKVFYPLRVVWLIDAFPSNAISQAAFSVPTKKISSAVHRNRIKRQMREAFRLNKLAMYDCLRQETKQIIMMWIYLSKDQIDYRTISQKMQLSLQYLQAEIEKN